MHLRFSEDQDEVPCPSYRLHEGRTCGCLLPEGGDRILYLTLSSGTQRLVTTSQWLSEHCESGQLSPPRQGPSPQARLPGRGPAAVRTSSLFGFPAPDNRWPRCAQGCSA